MCKRLCLRATIIYVYVNAAQDEVKKAQAQATEATRKEEAAMKRRQKQRQKLPRTKLRSRPSLQKLPRMKRPETTPHQKLTRTKRPDELAWSNSAL